MLICIVTNHGEIAKFLNSLFGEKIVLNEDLKWTKYFENPIEISEIIGTFIENTDKYNINMWVSLDNGIFINVTEHNADKLIRYMYERFPY